MSEETTQYVISARNRKSGMTESITDPMSEREARTWKPNLWFKKSHTYFRVSKHPFKNHKKGH